MHGSLCGLRLMFGSSRAGWTEGKESFATLFSSRDPRCAAAASLRRLTQRRLVAGFEIEAVAAARITIVEQEELWYIELLSQVFLHISDIWPGDAEALWHALGGDEGD